MDGAIAQVREDFDRIALLPEAGWDHNRHHHERLLRQAPPHCADALDVGCGTGAFARLLASRSDHVLALDLAPNMIDTARSRSPGLTHIDFEVADVMERELPAGHFDCVASIATMHHLPLESGLVRLRESLRPGGVLLVLDLFQPESPADWIAWGASYPLAAALRSWHSGTVRSSREARAVWEEHGRHDRYSTLREVGEVCARVVPGARVCRHLLWRYSLRWRKPDAAPMGHGA